MVRRPSDQRRAFRRTLDFLPLRGCHIPPCQDAFYGPTLRRLVGLHPGREGVRSPPTNIEKLCTPKSALCSLRKTGRGREGFR